MQQVNTPMRDPAPSRVKYKLQRLWLTPVYRALIRKGLPFACVSVAGLVYFTDPSVQHNIVAAFEKARLAVEQRPEFMVQQIRIQGAPASVDKLIRETLTVELPVSSFRIDLVAMKLAVEKIETVETASLLIGAKGVLEIGIVARVPALVWRTDEGLKLLDAQGQISGGILRRKDLPELPLVAGNGVEANVPEAIALFKKLSPIRDRVRGLMRVGERRWDVVLDRDLVLKLPEEQPVSALGYILALHQAQDILNRDILVVDIRDGRKPILQLSKPALDGLKKLRLTANEKDI